MKKPKVAIISTNRADIGILNSTLLEIQNHKRIEWDLVLSGGHLEETALPKVLYKEYSVKKKTVPISLKNQNSSDIRSAFEEAFNKASKLYASENYTAVLVTGDRFEMYAFALAAFFLKIKVFHLHAGEETFGAIDNVFRHSISLFADVHFCSLPDYVKRVKELKKDALRVLNVGAPSLDGLMNLKMLSKADLEKRIGFKIQSSTALVTLHPETYSRSPIEDIEQFILGLDGLDLRYIVTASNVDEGGDLYNDKLKKFCMKKPEERVFINSLGKTGYFSALRCVDLMIGNSSSGILEAASFGLPVVNVGDRQKGRIRPKNVLDAKLKSGEIRKAVKRAIKSRKLKISNPYQSKKKSAVLIVSEIEKLLLKGS